MEPRPCLLARRCGHSADCSDQCPFWECGGAVIPAGCALERILPEEDWSPGLAEAWLRIRDGAGSAEDWQPTSFFSTLLR